MGRPPVDEVPVVKALSLLAVMGLPLTTWAQTPSRHGPRPTLPRAVEMRLARSAAPREVSAGARVWLWDGSRYVVGDSGTTSVNCYVGRPWVPSVEPHCLDAEGSSTVMPVLMQRVVLYAQGKSDPEVEQEIAAGLRAGRYRLPTRPAMTYMMSAHQALVTGSGAPVGAWQPHLMVFFPDLPDRESGLPGFVQGVGFVENPKTPFSAYVIPLRSFADTLGGR